MRQLFEKRLTRDGVRGFVKDSSLFIVWDYNVSSSPFVQDPAMSDTLDLLVDEGYLVDLRTLGLPGDVDETAQYLSTGYQEVLV